MANQPLADRARAVLNEEASELMAAASRLGSSFDKAIDCILSSKGRVAMTGMGKHGLVARKIAATLASTGTVAYFLNPAEGRHGDLGMVHPSDIVVAVSNSGSTSEVLECLPFFKRNGNTLIAMTGNMTSPLAQAADVVLDVGVAREVCPLDLAPTTSTTVALAVGDAIAVVLMERRNFRSEDFALRHPGGRLGRRLLLTVGALTARKANPVVSQSATYGEAIEVITKGARGAVSVVDESGVLCGIVTDGDLRRALQAAASDSAQTVADFLGGTVGINLSTAPLFVEDSTPAVEALQLMEHGPRKVLVLPVVNSDRKPVGMLTIHDLVEADI